MAESSGANKAQVQTIAYMSDDRRFVAQLAAILAAGIMSSGAVAGSEHHALARSSDLAIMLAEKIDERFDEREKRK